MTRRSRRTLARRIALKAAVRPSRRFERIPLESGPVEIFVEQGPLGRIFGKRSADLGVALRNLSECGMGVVVKTALRRHTVVRAVARVPHVKQPVEAIAKVIWCVPDAKEPGLFLAGLDFLSVSEGYSAALHHLRRIFKSPGSRSRGIDR
ncbi:MAG: PilZ domain-containing protein [Planctomycetes bacterium]|nr:PilZ domain-containing protein [Planctomycetota bacterium]